MRESGSSSPADRPRQNPLRRPLADARKHTIFRSLTHRCLRFSLFLSFSSSSIPRFHPEYPRRCRCSSSATVRPLAPVTTGHNRCSFASTRTLDRAGEPLFRHSTRYEALIHVSSLDSLPISSSVFDYLSISSSISSPRLRFLTKHPHRRRCSSSTTIRPLAPVATRHNRCSSTSAVRPPRRRSVPSSLIPP